MDIDIDLANRQDILKLLKHVPARSGDRKHNTGVYFHRVPTDPFKNICTIDHKDGEEHRYFKIDLLNVNIYKEVRDENHLSKLINTEPLWELLEHAEFCSQIFHLSGNEELVKKLAPKNLEQLAITLALIRPSKRYLTKDIDWDRIHKEIWLKPNDGSYYFKKAHSFSYAMAVIVHMNLMCEQLQR
jgi:DNA polymerase III alpha subunit